MLGKVLKRHLGTYKKVLALVVGLQAVQATAALLLPTINANIIDLGVLRGDTRYIRNAGAVMALREAIGLSSVLAFAIPLAAIILGTIVARMVPAFQLMQERIDQINRVLREQITGIRVVRAFVREPQEEERFERANDDLT